MLNRFKTALYNVVGSFDPGDGALGGLGPGVTSSLPTAGGVVRTGVISSSLREKVIFILEYVLMHARYVIFSFQ